jgi:hypothetical protein
MLGPSVPPRRWWMGQTSGPRETSPGSELPLSPPCLAADPQRREEDSCAAMVSLTARMNAATSGYTRL